MRPHFVPALACMLALFIVTTAHAGPPAVCHPIDIGDATSLPMGQGPVQPDKAYDRDRLIADTLTILDESDDPLVHIETLRRATVYVRKDRRQAKRLLEAVLARTRPEGASANALVWLDAGFLAQALRQGEVRIDKDLGARKNITGYAWMHKAIELEPNDARYEFAAAIVTVMDNSRLHRSHVKRANALAEKDSLVARNLAHHQQQYWHHFR
ncbi:MAG: hypothetical protein AAF432_04880 [Planctomycetota bacterium]